MAAVNQFAPFFVLFILVASVCLTYSLQYYVVNSADSIANTASCSVPSSQCNLRSAWSACLLQPSPIACSIYLPTNGVLYMNSMYGSLSVNVSANITIWGNGATVAPVEGAEWTVPLFNIWSSESQTSLTRIYFDAQDVSFNSFDGSTVDGVVVSARGKFDVTLTNVQVSGISSFAGAIYADGYYSPSSTSSHSSLTIVQSFFSNSVAMVGGAAVYVENAVRTEIVGSQFVGLQAENGSAITGVNLVDMFSVTNKSSFVNCSASLCGGSIYISSASTPNTVTVQLYDTTFSDSIAKMGGAIFTTSNLSVEASNLYIFNSYAEVMGGGMYCENFINVSVVESNFRNIATSGPGGALLFLGENGVENVYVIDSVFTNLSSVGGAGVFIENVNVFVIRGSKFYNNVAFEGTDGGGGVLCSVAAAVVVERSYFESCSATTGNGGSIRILYASIVSIVNSQFQHSFSALSGSVMNIGFSSNITINNIYVADSNSTVGAAVYLSQVSNAQVLNSRFYQNYGGALRTAMQSANIYVRNSTFISSKSPTSAGAVYLSETNNIIFSKCNFRDNSAVTLGGVFYMDTEVNNVRILECMFQDNYVTTGQGGAMFVDSGVDELIIAGSTFENNRAPIDGGAIYLNDGNNNIVVMAYDNYDSYTVVQTAHPYISANPVNGVPYTILYQTVSSSDAEGFIIYLNPASVIWHTDTLNIYGVSSSGNKTLYFSGNTDFPGVQAPALYVSGKSVIFDFVGPSNNLFFLSNEFGFIAYVVPVTKHPKHPTYFTSNVAEQNGGGMFFLFDHQFPVVVNTYFQNNSASHGSGGGAFFELANFGLSMWRVYFYGNKAATGGSLVLGNGHFGVTIHKCYFINSTASQTGGAIAMTSGNGNGIFLLKAYNSVNISHSELTNNTAGDGGAVYLDVGNIVELVHCTLGSNMALVQYGGAILSNQNNQLSLFHVVFEYNYALSAGGAVFSAKANQVFMQHSLFVGNSAGSGGGAVGSVAASTIQFCADNTFEGNAAGYGGGAILLSASTFWSGGYYCLFSEKMTVNGPSLEFTGNSAPRGSAVLLRQVTFGSIYKFNSIPVTFQSNVASVGGTVYWIKDSVMYKEPYGLNDSFTLTFYNNIAAYGNRSATQAVQTILPTIYDVSVYDQSLVPPIEVRIADYYGQLIPLNGTSTVYATIVDSSTRNCSGFFPYLSGHDLAGNGVTFKNGVASFASLSAFCAPQGSVSVQFQVRVGSETKLASQQLAPYYITNTSTFYFRSCQAGEYSHNGECIECPSGTYNLDVVNADSCTSCIGEPGVWTCYTNNIILVSRYWRRYPTNQAVLPCTMVDNCLGGNLTGDASCAQGYQGPLCGVCQSGYYLSNNVCESCGSGGNLSPGLTASIIFVAVIIILLLSCSFYKYVYVPDDLDMNSDSLELTTTQLVYLWGKMKFYSFVVKIKIIAANVQIVSSVDTTFKVHMPMAFSRFSSGMGVVNLNFAALVSFGCSISSYNFFGRLLLATLLPLIIFVLFSLAYGVQYLMETIKYHRSEQKVTEKQAHFNEKLFSLKNSYTTYLFGITYLILPMVTTTIFQTFLCTNIDPDSENPTETSRYLTADLSISCQSNEYRDWRIYAILMIFVYPIGIPALYFTLLYLNREEIMHRDDDDEIVEGRVRKASSGSFDHTQVNSSGIRDGEGADSMKNPLRRNRSRENDGTLRNFSKESTLSKRELSPHVSRLAFLWLAYQPRYWYWEIVETTRRLLLTAGLSVIAPGSSSQNVLSVMLAFFYVKLYGYFKPYKNDVDDYIAEVGQVAVFVTFFIALIVQNSLLANSYNLALGLILVLASVAIFACTIAFAIYEYQQDVLLLSEEQSQLASELFGRFAFLCDPFSSCCAEDTNALTVSHLQRQNADNQGDLKSQLRRQQKYKLDGEAAATNRFRWALLQRKRQRESQDLPRQSEAMEAAKRVVTVNSPLAPTNRRKRSPSSPSPVASPVASPTMHPASRKNSGATLASRSASGSGRPKTHNQQNPDIELADILGDTS
jgi:hypothetical protein